MVDRHIRATDTAGLLLANLPPGTRIGDYLIDAPIGSHGTGSIYAATHLVLPRRATIKVMPAMHAVHRTTAVELLREACIVEALEHAGIPRVYECGMLPDRRPWIATELVAGKTLEHTILHGDLDALAVALLIRDLADILEHAHGRGIAHGRITPQAIVIPDRKRFPVCLVDWSSARTHDATTPQPLVLAPYARRYLAPEQLAGAAVDGQSDIYALGVVARELLESAQPGSPRRRFAELPPMLAALVSRLLATDPSRRPNGHQVRAAAAMVANQLEPDAASPHFVDDGATEPVAVPVPRVITSETSAQVSGEIRSITAG